MTRHCSWTNRAIRLTVTILAFFTATQDAQSQILPDFSLVVLPDASIWIQNHSDNLHSVQAYYISTPSPVADVAAWNSLEDRFLADSESFRSVFGQHITEWTMPSDAFTQPDGSLVYLEDSPILVWDPHLTWPIGKPLGNDLQAIRNGVDAGQITWFADYCELCADDLPIIFEIPEPATLALLLCGLPVLSMLAWRRRRCP
jgi:hypothetical protein